MSEPSIYFSEVNARQGAFHRRAFLLGGLAGAGLLTLGGRLLSLQVLEAGRYEKLSDSNQFNYRLKPPPRGLILDRNGVVLASNRPNFRLLVTRDEDTDVDAVLQTVSNIIDMDPDRLRRAARDIRNAPRRNPVVVKEDLSWEEFSRINVRAPELPAVTADMGEVRVYPFGGAFAHVIGYVAKVSDKDLEKAGGPKKADPLLLHPGFRIGKQGVEKALDERLRGRAGAEKVEVDARGREVRKDPDGDIPATPGAEVRLTLDADIQNRAVEVFGEESGAAVMMDCRNGDILCMVSAPSFDANKFVRGLTGPEYKALANYDHKPLFNKALTATYPPGSTFKTMTALAALEAGVDPKATRFCSGGWAWGGRVWKCDGHHGSQNMHQAIATSCDIYFYQTALAIGPDRIHAVARQFGLGDIFDIGIPGQKAGLVPDKAYKRARFPKDPVWHPGETPSMGIGQGYTNLNPLQLCVMTARLANGVKALHPRLIRSIGGQELPSGASYEDLPFPREHVDFVRRAMAEVTLSGTAARVSDLGLGEIKMAGKTGTAQSRNYGGGRGVHGTNGPWPLRDHAWFVAFAPYDDPRYAISVLVEHGGFGAAAAAPRAREIMRVALLKDPEIRARIERPLPVAQPVSTAPAPAAPAVPPPPAGADL